MADFNRSDTILTNIRDTKAMVELLKYEAVRYNRSGRPFSILLAEIDEFETMVEVRGIEFANKVKADIATVLNSLSRDQDIVAPWDGTLYIMLLPETDSKGLQIIGEKMRSTVAGKAVEIDGTKLPVTVTIGVCTINKELSLLDALEKTYHALQRGRNLGRNRVEVAPSI